MSTRPVSEREFTFTQRDFEDVKKALYVKSGIKLADSKDSMVYSRLARRLRALKLTSFASYLAYLNSNSSEEQAFINALTTNLTSFFRENHHFPILKEYLQTHPGAKRIWCAASSTGEEPYSIAMTVAETFGTFNSKVEIIASDIDSTVLEKASEGVYLFDSLQNMTQQQRQKFFLRGKGVNQGKVRVLPELRKMVKFQQINLMHKKWDITPDIDVIFCRNVMIYFDKNTQIEILTRMVQLMNPNGLYIAGHSETFANASHLVFPLGKTVYRPVSGGKFGL